MGTKRYSHDAEIEAYLNSLPPDTLPTNDDIKKATNSPTRQAANSLYNGYRARHPEAPRTQTQKESARKGRDERDEKFINARRAGLSHREIKENGLGKKGGIERRSARLTRERKTPHFRAVSDETREKLEQARELRAQGMTQEKIGEKLGISRVYVYHLLRRGGRGKKPE